MIDKQKTLMQIILLDLIHIVGQRREIARRALSSKLCHALFGELFKGERLILPQGAPDESRFDLSAQKKQYRRAADQRC